MKINTTSSELSIKQKIGMMLIARTPVDEESYQFTLDLIRNHSLGGIHFRAVDSTPNFPVDSKRIKELIKEVKETANYPILICEDMESGYSEGHVSLCPPMSLASTNSEKYAYEFGRITACEAKKDGYNLVFGPILDIALNPLASCVGPRSFGSSPTKVAKIAANVIRGYQSQGFIVTGKHFPGFGASPIDSHIDMVVLNSNKQQLLQREMLPYQYCYEKANMSGIMMGHIMVPQIDSTYPASLSKKIISFLRSTGYDNLIITDSLSMVGLTTIFGLENAHKLAFAAGNDMILACYRTSIKQSYKWLCEAYENNMISESQINQSVNRIIRAQEKTLQTQQTQFNTTEALATASVIAKASIAEKINDASISFSIDPNGRHLFIIQDANYYQNPQNGKIEKENYFNIDAALAAIQNNFPNSDIVRICGYPSKYEIEAVLAKSLDCTSIVPVLYSFTASYAGSSDITHRLLALLNGLVTKISAIVHYGNPYAAREYPDVPRIIFGFDKKECQRYGIEALAGHFCPTGDLPVSF